MTAARTASRDRFRFRVGPLSPGEKLGSSPGRLVGTDRSAHSLARPEVVRVRPRRRHAGRAGDLPRERADRLQLPYDDVPVAADVLERAAGEDERLAAD